MADNNTTEITIPNQGLTVTEIVIAKWYKKVGEMLKKDEVLLDFETDEAVVELGSPTDGILSRIVAQEGETIPIGGVVGIIVPAH
jgi:pyruvate/2-oxoglutarate dehydrogenase complex dihydrolipoamide acyltransferase (E2) component